MVKTNTNTSKMNYQTASNVSNMNSYVNTQSSNNTYITNTGSCNRYINNNYSAKTETISFQTNYNATQAELERKRKEREKLIERFKSDLNKAEQASGSISVQSLKNFTTNDNGSHTVKEINQIITSASNDSTFNVKVTDVNGGLLLKGSKYIRVYSDGSYKFYVEGELKDFDVLKDEKIKEMVDINEIEFIKKDGASTDIYLKDGSVTHIIEGTNNYICGEDSDGNFNFAYHIEDDGSLSNIDIYGAYTEANGQFGGNQSDLEDHVDMLLCDDKIASELENCFPGSSWNEKASYLREISHSACGFTGKVNGLFSEYVGREKEFKETFGYDMYKIDNNGNLDFNYENMIVSFYDYYLTKQNGNNIYEATANAEGFYPECTQEFSNFLEENYGVASTAENYVTEEDRENGGDISRIETKDEIIDIYHSFVDQGKDNIMIGSWGYHLKDYDTGATTYYSRDGEGHAMTILGEENGNLIVTSWGEKYILDLDYMDYYEDGYSYFYTTDFE